MELQTFLGAMPKQAFVENFFHRFPYSQSGAASSVCELGSWETLASLLQCTDADTMVVREGSRYTGPTPTSAAEALALSREGYTLLARHAERHSPRINALAENFRRDFSAPVDVHLYATPPGKHGFGWHYDAEDVFILQTAGVKQYSLRKNTVNPWPVVETLPADMAYEREIMPLMRVTLGAGDWLYIPCGYWHKAESIGDETSISLAVGVLSSSAVDIYDFVRRQILDSLIWRQRLPVRGEASPWAPEKRQEIVREMFHQLGADLSKMFHDERLIRSFIESEASA